MAMALRSSRVPALPLFPLSVPGASPPSHVELLPSWRSPDVQALLPAPLASQAPLRSRRPLVICANAAAQVSAPEGMYVSLYLLSWPSPSVLISHTFWWAGLGLGFRIDGWQSVYFSSFPFRPHNFHHLASFVGRILAFDAPRL